MNYEKVCSRSASLIAPKQRLTGSCSPQFGWLLSYWNLAGVPFSYAYAAIYMATHDPATYTYSKPVLAFLFITITFAQAM